MQNMHAKHVTKVQEIIRTDCVDILNEPRFLRPVIATCIFSEN